jgi:hypothetical protein
MAKKSRRVRKGAQPRLSEAQLARPQKKPLKAESRQAKAPAAEPTGMTLKQPAAAGFREEYHYVVRDLERIGILAAMILGGLVILSILV